MSVCVVTWYEWPIWVSSSCNVSLITTSFCDCHLFSAIDVSEGSVAMHMRCGGICNKYFAANLLENWTVKEISKSVEN